VNAATTTTTTIAGVMKGEAERASLCASAQGSQVLGYRRNLLTEFTKLKIYFLKVVVFV